MRSGEAPRKREPNHKQISAELHPSLGRGVCEEVCYRGARPGRHRSSPAGHELRGCSKRAMEAYPGLTLVRRFTCKMPLFLSGRCWVRTSDLLLVSSISRISSRTGMSGNLAVLQHFCLCQASAVSAAY